MTSPSGITGKYEVRNLLIELQIAYGMMYYLLILL